MAFILFRENVIEQFKFLLLILWSPGTYFFGDCSFAYFIDYANGLLIGNYFAKLSLAYGAFYYECEPNILILLDKLSSHILNFLYCRFWLIIFKDYNYRWWYVRDKLYKAPIVVRAQSQQDEVDEIIFVDDDVEIDSVYSDDDYEAEMSELEMSKPYYMAQKIVVASYYDYVDATYESFADNETWRYLQAIQHWTLGWAHLQNHVIFFHSVWNLKQHIEGFNSNDLIQLDNTVDGIILLKLPTGVSMNIFEFLVPHAQGGCFSRRSEDHPPEPPPQLNLGPPPPIEWEDTDSDKTESSFEDRLAAYAAQFPIGEKSDRVSVDDDSYDDEQFDNVFPPAQSQSSMYDEVESLRAFLRESIDECRMMSEKYFSIESLGIRIQFGELGIVVIRMLFDMKVSKSLYQFVMAILSFYKDLMSKTYLMVIDQFGLYITKCLSLCFDFVTNCSVLDMPMAQSESDGKFNDFIFQFRNCLTHYDRVINSEFASKAVLFMSLITLSPFCVANNITFESFGMSELIEYTKKAKIDKFSRPTFIYNVLDLSCYMMEKMQYIVMNGNFACIYIDDIEVQKVEEEYTFLKYYEDKMNLLPNHLVTLDQYLKRVDNLQAKLRDVRQFYSKDVASSYFLTEYKRGLARMKYAVMDKLKVSTQRPLPIGLMLHGPPGIGKSVLCDQIIKACYDNAIFLGHFPEDHKYDMGIHKYTLNPKDEFMSEFRISNEVVLMDDVDSYLDKINEAKEGGLIADIISFVNEIPYVTPQAHLEDKGKIPLLAEFVIGTTNSPTAGIEKVFRQHSGALRRLIFIDIAVKTEFRAHNSTKLGKIHNADNLFLHDFHLRRYDPVGTGYNEVFFNPDTCLWEVSRGRAVNLKELVLILRDYIQKPHYEQARMAKYSLDRFLKADMCQHCGITSLLCDCPVAQSGTRVRVVKDILCPVRDSFLECLYLFYAGFIFLLVGSFALIPYLLTRYRYVHIEGGWVYKLLNILMVRPITTAGMFRPAVERVEMGVHVLYLYGCHSKQLFQAMSDINTLQSCFNRHKQKILMVTGIGVVLFAFKMLKRFLPTRGYCDLHDCNHDVTQECLDRRNEAVWPWSQSGKFIKPKSDENQARVNPWKAHITPIDKLPSDTSSTPLDVLLKCIQYNLCYFQYEIEKKVEGGRELIYKHIDGLGLYSNFMLVPKHWYDEAKLNFPLKVRCIRSEIENNISPNRWFYIDETSVVQMNSNLDYVILFHGALGPFRDVRCFMTDVPITGRLKALGLLRDINGKVIQREINALTFQDMHYMLPGGVPNYLKGYIGQAVEPYREGDCGSLIIAQAKNAWFLCSYHIAGITIDGRNLCYSIPLYKGNFNNDPVFAGALCNSYNGVDLNSTYVTDQDLSISPEVHAMCPSRRIQKGVGEIFGNLDLPRRKMKTTVVDTIMCEDVLAHEGKLDKDYFSPKEINSRDAIQIALEQSMNQPTFIPCHLQSSALALSCIYIRTIDELDLYVPNKPFDLDVGINGCDGVTYIDRLPVSTSGGFAHKGPKLKHLVLLEPNEYHQVRYGFDEDLQLEYDKMLYHYQNSDDAYSIVWDFNLKDEPISAEKIRLNKCRVFNAGPLVFNVLVRQYFLWCVPIFSGKFRHRFGMAIGANVLSEDWTILFDYITRFGTDRIIAGDYKAFDKNMPREVMLAAFQVLFDIMNVHGWTKEDVLVARRLASEIISGLYNANGTLMRLAGNPSGNCLTTIINSISNIMYIMIACQTIEEEKMKHKEPVENIDYLRFFDYVSIVTYGDDNIMSSRLAHINHTSISNALSKYGLEYTMADKESESRPFIFIEEADFLKRRFEPDVNFIGVVAAPLSEKSIIKSLTVCNRSPSITFEEQCAQIIDSACREYYHYGENKFNKQRKFLCNILDKYNLGAWLPRPVLPTYEELKEDQLSNHLEYSFKVGLGLVPSPEAGKITLEKEVSTQIIV